MLNKKLQTVSSKKMEDSLLTELILPLKLKKAVARLENRTGVYVFANEQNYPLYIGKSKQVKSRVLSHLRAFARERRKTDLLLQTHNIQFYPTAGEYTALFKEAEMVKQFLPLYNKQLRRTKNYVSIQITSSGRATFNRGINLEKMDMYYGIFPHVKKAKDTLLELVEKSSLCKKHCGLSAMAPCFNYQLKKCHYACQQTNYPNLHFERLRSKLSDISLQQWPYPRRAVAVKESDALYRYEQYIVIYQWCYLGTVDTEAEVFNLLKKDDLRNFDKDYYRLALGLLNTSKPKTLLFMDIE